LKYRWWSFFFCVTLCTSMSTKQFQWVSTEHLLISSNWYLFQRIVYCSHMTHFYRLSDWGPPKSCGPLAAAQPAPPLILHLLRQKRKNRFFPQQQKNLSLNLEDPTAWGSMNDFRMEQTVLLDWDPLILRWTPAWVPDIAADRLSYLWPLRIITSKSFCFSSSDLLEWSPQPFFRAVGKNSKKTFYNG